MAFKLFDFCLHNQETTDVQTTNGRKDNKQFLIEMFAMNQKGETASILVEGFKPFFYIKVDDIYTDGSVLDIFLALSFSFAENRQQTY